MALSSAFAVAQKPAERQDKAVFIPSKPGYYQNTIMRDITSFKEQKKEEKVRQLLRMDMTGIDVPRSVKEFKTAWKNNPISQGNTGTCWCYSTSSFFESEVKRLTNQDVKIAELYTVYWEYVEKARRFVQERGDSNFDEGSEANAVTRIMKQYGAVPADAYLGRPAGQPFNDHSKMVEEMKAYLNSVKASNAWNEEQILSTIKSIMNHYLGEPPTMVNVSGRKLTPLQYMTDVLKLNPDDYVDITSMLQAPYYTKTEYNVPDNWWHDANYHNVPLDVFMQALNKAAKAGFSIVIGGDVSEPGFNAAPGIVMVPSFDIPSANIDENARQFRFSNGTTTDDHGMHLVGWAERANGTWYLIKDSSAGSRNVGAESENFGYYFMHEDYIKLKMMDFMVHKDAVKDILAKFK